ncbi:hypothetical protein ACUY2G_12295 [Corynebacterium guaraldiae]
MTTLADLTSEDRANCVGMWCDYTRDGEEKDLVIMVADVNDAGRIPCVNPGAPSPTAWAPEPWMLTPRPDLPRAWQADGTPPAGQWEHAEYLGDYKDMTDVYHYDGDPTHRRWVGSWEEA